MKHISIIVPEGDSSLSNLEATFKMFHMANDQFVQMGKSIRFEVHLVGISQQTKVSNGLFRVTPTKTIHEITQTDLIIIPAIHGDTDQILKSNAAFIPWMISHYHQGAELASLCIGAFLLAKTGLLNGKQCATHWLMATKFREMYPEVTLVDDKIMTDHQGLYTSGGAYSSLNLNLYLIEKYAGRSMSILHSKIFQIDINRQSQSPFIIFQGQKNHQDKEVLYVQEYLETNFAQKLTVDQLAEIAATSRRSFERRFKQATKNTALEYIQRIRIEAAKRNFETNDQNVSEVMFAVGYSDPKTFRSVFKRITGLTPIEYRNRYHS
ncbi:helix-turn-helix domain-containing protein [Algoriphagus sp.]|uniref:GlxA family transcriptional regulator n=1 Tax=Algoriphagus sp. TaxID=1872435 RepID=UPI002620461E|nr:helix-turn-helix domain-containing protein [Algoriphagus sp.]